MLLLGDIGNTEIKICLVNSDSIIVKKISFSSKQINNFQFKKIFKTLKLENFKINSFDFAFIDADKINYLNYYLRCIHLVKSKGIIVLDNMLWSGEVIDPKDEDAKKLREVGDFIQNDTRVINMLLPIRDGLLVCIKK